MLKPLLIFGFILTGLFGSAQNKLSKKNLKKAESHYQQGIVQMDQGDLQSAMISLLSSYELNPENTKTLLALADLSMENKDYFSCIGYIEKAFHKDSSLARKLVSPLLRACLGAGQFTKAKTFLHYCRDFHLADTNEINMFDSLIAFSYGVSLKNLEKGLNIQHLSDSLNSSSSEYFPSLYLNGNAMVFTRRIDNERNEDFFYSIKKNDTWRSAIPLPGKVNTSYNEGGQKISEDGKMMVFTGCNYPEGIGSCDIYYTNKANEEWTERKNLGYPINTEYWESAPCLSSGKNAIYFSSNRPGGFGGMDIYVSYMNSKGEWGDPENLGPTINTNGDEMFPFLHLDNTTFYFTSNGWKTIGGSDIFVSRKSEQGFTMPINLGYPINTVDNESGLVVSTNGKSAYFSSDRFGGYGKMDLYTFELASETQAFPIEKTEKIILQNIQFETGKWQLNADAQAALKIIVNYLKSNPGISIQINGHTDNVGKDDDNLFLSTQRAKAVVEFLIREDISAQRLAYKGFGASMPIGDNQTEEGRAKNRRTEMVILSN